MSVLSVLLYTLLVTTGIGIFAALYGFTQEMDVEQPRKAKSAKVHWQIILLLPLYVVGLGIVSAIIAVLVAGPALALLYIFHNSYAISFGLGIPLGILLLVSAYALFDFFATRKNEIKSEVQSAPARRAD